MGQHLLALFSPMKPTALDHDLTTSNQIAGFVDQLQNWKTCAAFGQGGKPTGRAIRRKAARDRRIEAKKALKRNGFG